MYIAKVAACRRREGTMQVIVSSEGMVGAPECTMAPTSCREGEPNADGPIVRPITTGCSVVACCSGSGGPESGEA